MPRLVASASPRRRRLFLLGRPVNVGDVRLLPHEGGAVEGLDLLGNAQGRLAARHDVPVQHVPDRLGRAAGRVGEDGQRDGVERIDLVAQPGDLRLLAVGPEDRDVVLERAIDGGVGGLHLLAVAGRCGGIGIEERIAHAHRADEHLRPHRGEQLLRAGVARGDLGGLALDVRHPPRERVAGEEPQPQRDDESNGQRGLDGEPLGRSLFHERADSIELRGPGLDAGKKGGRASGVAPSRQGTPPQESAGRGPAGASRRARGPHLYQMNRRPIRAVRGARMADGF